ncbi:MAG: hypothetical protein KJ069_09725 [Anaerolineae bacterium]|nr:hypothetical protein [Anaerolineae bacterium]
MTGKQQRMPFILMSLVVTAVLAFFATTTYAQSSATITADRHMLTVGDPVILTVSVTHPEGSVVLFPELEANWGDLIVRSQSAPETVSNGNGTSVTSQQIDARLFVPGDFQTPPLTITIADTAGNLSETAVPPLPLSVQSVLVEGDTELRDIKPQASLPLPTAWPYVVGGLFVVMAMGAFNIYMWRRGQTAVDNRLPYEKVLDALVAIDKQGYVKNGRYKEQYAAVSDTLRTYFETITKIPFTDRTTAEIRYDLAAGPLNLGDAQRLLLLLEDADWVKFAKVTPTQHEAERLTQDARQLVLDTKPEAPALKPVSRKPLSVNRKPSRLGKPKSDYGLRMTDYEKQETTI